MNFRSLQKQWADHLRDPSVNEAPSGIEERRLGIYRELIHGNIESFISSGFPVLRSLYGDGEWERLVRAFIAGHACTSPYFLEIGREFLTFLQNDYQPVPSDPPFLDQLAHYEWAELALDVADVAWPESVNRQGDLMLSHPVVSPLAWRLSYTFPVHRISREFVSQRPSDTPVFLVVWRNRAEEVRFMEANAATCRLLQILEEAEAVTGRRALLQLAGEMAHPDPSALLSFGEDLLRQLAEKDIVLGSR